MAKLLDTSNVDSNVESIVDFISSDLGLSGNEAIPALVSAIVHYARELGYEAGVEELSEQALDEAANLLADEEL